MKTRDIKRKIKDAYKLNNNLLSEIMVSCEGQEQITPNEEIIQNGFSFKRLFCNKNYVRLTACMACVLIAIVSVSIFCLTNSGNKPAVSQTAETFIYIDVNPSIELQVNGSGNVTDCFASNDDAKDLLKGIDFKGADVNEAITEVLNVLQANGYLSGDTDSILVSVDAVDKEKISDMLSKITEKINSVFEREGIECSIIAQEVEASDELKQRAKENGVSVGKMHLVEKMVAGLGSFSNDDAKELSALSIKELNFIYSVIPEKGENKLFAKDISLGKAGGFVGKDDAVNLLLGDLDIDRSEVEWHTITPSFQIDGGERRLVYDVSFQLKGDNAPQDFKVDCHNGNVLDKPSNSEGGGSNNSSNSTDADKSTANMPQLPSGNYYPENGGTETNGSHSDDTMQNDKEPQIPNNSFEEITGGNCEDPSGSNGSAPNEDDKPLEDNAEGEGGSAPPPDNGRDDGYTYQPPQNNGFNHVDNELIQNPELEN